jgi:hypothetical protein
VDNRTTVGRLGRSKCTTPHPPASSKRKIDAFIHAKKAAYTLAMLFAPQRLSNQCSMRCFAWQQRRGNPRWGACRQNDFKFEEQQRCNLENFQTKYNAEALFELFIV